MYFEVILEQIETTCYRNDGCAVKVWVPGVRFLAWSQESLSPFSGNSWLRACTTPGLYTEPSTV